MITNEMIEERAQILFVGNTTNPEVVWRGPHVKEATINLYLKTAKEQLEKEQTDKSYSFISDKDKEEREDYLKLVSYVEICIKPVVDQGGSANWIAKVALHAAEVYLSEKFPERENRKFKPLSEYSDEELMTNKGGNHE